MQHKRGFWGLKHPQAMVFLLLVVVLAVGGFMLMATDVAPPSQPIEKELDAKAFLELQAQ